MCFYFTLKATLKTKQKCNAFTFGLAFSYIYFIFIFYDRYDLQFDLLLTFSTFNIIYERKRPKKK